MTTLFTNISKKVLNQRKQKTFLIKAEKITFWDYLYGKKDRIWIKNGKPHREKDKPALETFLHSKPSTKAWFKNGKRHRARNKPAVVHVPNYEFYFFDGKRYFIKEDEFETKELHFLYNDKSGVQQTVIHSIANKPAIVYANGTKEWRDFGRLHRNKKPAIEYANGDKEWWIYGFRHREDGPAIIFGNNQYWYKNGEFIKKCIV